MRKLLLALGLLAAATFAMSAAETPPLTTNSVTVDNHGVLLIAAPKDWTFEHTNLPGSQPYAALRSPNSSIALEIWIYWDGFAKTNSKPTLEDFAQIVSNSCVRGYAPVSIEKKVVLEKLQGPAVSGIFARFSEAHWTPMLKSDYPNVASGMFRSDNLWGRFELLTYDKDGRLFKQGLQVLESIRRKP